MLLLSEPDSSSVYVFADSHQQLYGRAARMPETWPTLVLDVNCRNTRPIAVKVAAVFEDHASCLGADGQAPLFVEASSEVSQLSVVTQMTYRMLGEEHLRHGQIVVLSDSRTFIDRLRVRLAGEEPFVGLDGYGVVAETIHRFKGLEADVIIVGLTESNPDNLLPLATQIRPWVGLLLLQEEAANGMPAPRATLRTMNQVDVVRLENGDGAGEGSFVMRSAVP